MTRARRRALVATAAVLIVAALAAGWRDRAAIVVPPAGPRDPVVVHYLVDGRHSGLLLPCGDGRFVEYGYGEWSWYALGKDDWWRAPLTVLWPNPGTLGRRYLDAAGVAAVAASRGPEHLASFPVESRAVERLLARLDAEFAAGGPVHTNERYHMDFVRHPSRFWLGHDCHDEVAGWLRELGCSVDWAPVRTRLWVAERAR